MPQTTMPDRAGQTTAFLAARGWQAARRAPLAGDASARRYERLHLAGATAVLMDAPPGPANGVAQFVRIAGVLSGFGLSAPSITAHDPQAGLLLLEDLGRDVFAGLIARRPGLETLLYKAAVDVLVALHRHPPPPGLTALDPETLGAMTSPLIRHYIPGATGHASGAGPAIAAEIARLAAALCPQTPVMALRDYHAENLLWLPARAGPARVGLLDFQDAVASHAAYDLVSLLRDARRDVPAGLQTALSLRYAALTRQGAGFDAAMALLGAQRNLRILGVFARLCQEQGKPHYVALMPRVWRHLRRDLSHPALARLAALVQTHVPEPDPAALQRMRIACPQAPTT